MKHEKALHKGHRFEILEGKHDEEGKVYAKGDTFRSKNPLDKMFPGRFRKVGAAAPAPETEDESADEERDESEPEDVEHDEESGPKGKVSKPKITISKDKPKADEKALAARGEDVTKEFKLPEDGFQVFKRGDSFHVYNEGETDPIHPKGLKKTEVVSSVKDYLES